jgi:hypothetical protein
MATNKEGEKMKAKNTVYENGTASIKADTLDLVKAYGEKAVRRMFERHGQPALSVRIECSAVVLQRSSWVLHIPHADWEPVILCRKCLRELTAKYDEVDADYEIIPLGSVCRCDICKDGVVDELEYHLEMAELVGRAS